METKNKGKAGLFTLAFCAVLAFLAAPFPSNGQYTPQGGTRKKWNMH